MERSVGAQPLGGRTHLLKPDRSAAPPPPRFGVLTVSDRASQGVYEDLGGPAILQFFSEAIASPWSAVYRLVPDEQPLIEQVRGPAEPDNTSERNTDGGRAVSVLTSVAGPSFLA